jgi:major vault protein
MITIQRLSGGNPKKEFAIALLYLPLGPDFMSDTVEVETSDHARLKLSVTYNWKFDTSDKSKAKQFFAVRDFVGYSCRAIASRIRGTASRHTFEDFHKSSSELIR